MSGRENHAAPEYGAPVPRFVYSFIRERTPDLGFDQAIGRPALARDCRRVTEAAVQHREAWIALFRLLRAQYPAEMGQLELPE